jgi:hypothetical protein
MDAECVRFCARAFGATAIQGDAQIERVRLSTYDAVLLGSVITHHPGEVCSSLLTTIADRVRAGGVLVATNTGEVALERYAREDNPPWLKPHVEVLRASLRDEGSAYVAYPQHRSASYGLGFQTSEWLDAVVAERGLVPLWHRMDAWGNQAAHAWCRPA